jgi:hypothetical protein
MARAGLRKVGVMLIFNCAHLLNSHRCSRVHVARYRFSCTTLGEVISCICTVRALVQIWEQTNALLF